VEASPDGNTLLALVRYGGAYESTNGGATWVQIGTPYDFWRGVASSANGSQLLAASDFIYRSTDAGVTWQQLNIVLVTNLLVTNLISETVISTNASTHLRTTNEFSIALSSNIMVGTEEVSLAAPIDVNVAGGSVTGTNTVAVVIGAGVTVGVTPLIAFGPVETNMVGTNELGVGAVVPGTDSTNTTFNTVSILYPSGAVISNSTTVTNTTSTGVVSADTSGIHATFTNSLSASAVISNVPQHWAGVVSSADGTHLAAAANGGLIYTSTNSGISWLPTGAPGTNWLAITMSADGKTLAALAGSGLVLNSPDFGATWVATNLFSSSTNFGAIVCSADGSELMAGLYQNQIFTGAGFAQTPVATSGPMLAITVAGGNIILSWPADAGNFVVQQCWADGPMVWSDISATPVVTNGQNQVVLPMTTQRCFYRLRSQ